MVDDDTAVRETVVVQLEELGYRVLEAEDGAAALRVLESDAAVDLLFTDVVMPGGMNGVALAREAGTLRPGLKVLYTSGYTRNAVAQSEELELGTALLTKPYLSDDLGRKLREVLEA